MRLWGERFIFVTARMQRMMSWQAKLLIYEMASAPEVKETLANHLSMTESLKR